MISVTVEQLRQIAPRLTEAKAREYLPLLMAAAAEAEITTFNRFTMFLANLLHESGEFRYMTELWGPTSAQKRYEPPSTLAKRLGNTERGDGFRYRGRGVIQVTGRDNYRQAGKALGIDLESDPDKAAQPATAFRIAGWYWTKNNINRLCDKNDFHAVVKAINGGYNGLADRTAYLEDAIEVLKPVEVAAT